MCRPPFTEKSAPVAKPASSDATHDTIDAISSGVPKRFTGMVAQSRKLPLPSRCLASSSGVGLGQHRGETTLAALATASTCWEVAAFAPRCSRGNSQGVSRRPLKP